MKHALIAAACIASLASAAQAQMRRPDPDLNKDGKVTRAEFQKAEADSMLGRLDANKDGRITRDEAKAMTDRAAAMGRPEAGKRLDGMFALMDADKDGVLTRAEIETGAAVRFKKADANGDGSLSKAELDALRPARTRAG